MVIKSSVPVYSYTMESNVFDLNLADWNRTTRKLAIKSLVDSMKAEGFRIEQPIIIDKDKNIIDGQHRYLAAKELGISYFYKTYIGEKTSAELAVALNTNQKCWRDRDFLEHSQSELAMDIRSLMNQFPDINFGVILAIYSGANIGKVEQVKTRATNYDIPEACAWYLSLDKNYKLSVRNAKMFFSWLQKHEDVNYKTIFTKKFADKTLPYLNEGMSIVEMYKFLNKSCTKRNLK